MGKIIGVVMDSRLFDDRIENWNPTREQLDGAEPDVLEKIQRSEPELFQRIDQYRCQYFGITVDGRKRIYYNFFLNDTEAFDGDWRTEPVFVLDGGSDYFHLEYDLESRQCTNFYVNGEA